MKHFRYFYDLHVVCLEEGVNYVVGEEEALTSLCEALEFALYGSMKRLDKHSLINSRRVEEAINEFDWVGCKVRLVFQVTGEYRCLHRDLSFIGQNYAREMLGYSTFIPEIPHETYQRVHLKRGASVEEAEDAISKNVVDGPGFMLLHGVLENLGSRDKERLLGCLDDSGLQAIILSPPGDPPKGAVQLNKTIEHVIFRAHDFPFDPEQLYDRVEMNISNHYINKGDVLSWDLYGHPYTVEAVEVYPDGARYLRDVSELRVT